MAGGVGWRAAVEGTPALSSTTPPPDLRFARPEVETRSLSEVQQLFQSLNYAHLLTTPLLPGTMPGSHESPPSNPPAAGRQVRSSSAPSVRSRRLQAPLRLPRFRLDANPLAAGPSPLRDLPLHRMNKRQRKKVARRIARKRLDLILRYVPSLMPGATLSTAYWIAMRSDFLAYRELGEPISGVLWRKTRRGPRPGGYFWRSE
jgi:hypothetical protein